MGHDLQELGVLVRKGDAMERHRRPLVVEGGIALAARRVLAPVVGKAGREGVDVPAVVGRPSAAQQLGVRVLHVVLTHESRS